MPIGIRELIVSVFTPLEVLEQLLAVGLLLLEMAVALALEGRKKPMAVGEGLRWVRVMVCVLSGVAGLHGLAQKRQAALLAVS